MGSMRRGGRTTTAAVLVCALSAVLAALGAGAPTVARAAPLDRPDDPVVLTGAATAAFAGIAPGRLVAFRWNGAWQQVPVQVDERKLVNLRSAYPTPFSCSGTSGGYCYTPGNMTARLRYADAGTLVGADTDPLLDADDEVVFMAKDAGTIAPEGTPDPPGVAAHTGMRAAVADTLAGGTGSVYLFTSDGTLDPGAGAQYVTYTFAPTLGAFPGAYRFAAGTNPETSTVITPHYQRRFTDRWQESELKITRGAATGVDILDRTEAQFSPDLCVRSGLTFSKGEGTFLINKSGPVRAIRSFLGANSGPMTEKQQIFYAGREEDTVFLRVHAIPAILSFVDYSAAASGMKYRNNNNPSGVTIDGVPEDPVAGNLTWDSVDGAQGALTNVYTVQTTVAASKFTSFYRDTTSPPSAPCQGDGAFYGASGPYINGAINDSDEVTGGTERLNLTRNLYFGAPGASDGPGGVARVGAPLAATMGTFPADAQAPVTTDDVPPAWRTTPATVTLTAVDAGAAGGAVTTYYAKGVSPGTPTTRYDPASKPVLAGGERIRYFSVDRAGNVEADRTSAALRVETVAPSTTDDVPSTWQRGPVPVTLTAVDTGGSGVAVTYYSVGVSPGVPATVYDPASKPTLAHGERIRYLTVDAAGNAEAARTSSLAAKVDTIAPSTLADVPSGWRKTAATVTLTASDAGGSGVAQTLYATGPDPGVPSTVYDPASKPTLGDGERIRYRTIDVAGNVEADRTSAAATVDTGTPATTDDVPDGWQRGPVTATLVASDTGGSAGLRTYYAKAATPGAPTTLYDPAAKPVLGHGERIRYSTVDAAGNAEPARLSATVRIDAVAPTSSDDVPSGWRTTRPAVTLTASDAGGSGVDSIRYETGTAPAAPTAASPVYAAQAKPTLGDGERIRYAAVDGAGNVETAHVSTAAKVDGSVPATTILTAPPARGTDARPTFTFATAGPATFECAIDGGAWTACASPFRPLLPLAAGDHVFRVRATNPAGLVEGEPVTAAFAIESPAPSPLPPVEPAPDPFVPDPPVEIPTVVPRALRVAVGETRDAAGRALLPVVSGRATVRCEPDAGALPGCAVQVRAVAGGTVLADGSGSAGELVLRPTPAGRTALARGPLGVPATLSASGGGMSAAVSVRLVADASLTVGPLLRSAALPAAVRRALDGLARAVPKARAVVCTAYTDDRGRSAKADLALTRAQAAAACRALKARGVAAAWSAVGAGRARPVASNRTARGRASNRRLVVRVTH